MQRVEYWQIAGVAMGVVAFARCAATGPARHRHKRPRAAPQPVRREPRGAVPAFRAAPLRTRPKPRSSAPGFIAGTRIPDTKANRQVASVVEKYRQAMLRADIPAVIALIHPKYYSDAGTVQKKDDLDHRGLVRVLRKRLAYIKVVRYGIKIRCVVWVNAGRVELNVFIQGVFELNVPGGRTRVSRFADFNRMVLGKHQGRWLFLRGM